MEEPIIGIGTEVWFLDPNRRVYRDPEPGRIYRSAPIYREHFRTCRIVGENRASWLCGYDAVPIWRFPKKGGAVRDGREIRGGDHVGFRFFLTREAVEDNVFITQHCHRIADLVRHLDSAIELRRVAAIVHYDPDAEEDPHA
jgi:hypothetical protein